MKILKNSHAFVVTGVSSSAERDAVRKHCIPLLQRESFKKPNGDIVYGETKKFYAFNQDKTECRFHINDFQNFCDDLRAKGVNLNDVEVVDSPMYTPTPALFKINDFYKPRDNQKLVIDYFKDPYPHIKMCELETGGGKAEEVNEPVLTPSGWRRIGDLRVGDEVICPDNTISKVTGVYPQGIRPLYRFSLQDGRSTLVDRDHLWKFKEDGEWKVNDTGYLENLVSIKEITLPSVHPDINNDYTDQTIRAIDYERDGEAVCISIDHPERLYITRDYIVTHNTYSALQALSDMQCRALLSIRPQYFENWVKAIFGDEEAGKPPITDIQPDRFLMLKGSDNLKSAIRSAVEGEFEYDFIMISNATLFRFYKVYEEQGSTLDSYGCEPWELCQVFGVGAFLKDEGHMDFHANFRADLYLHVPLSITLSGTFSSENPFIKAMQQLQHPLNSRAPTVAPTKFRKVTAVRYSINPKRELRYRLRGRTEYNHNQLEESILKDKKARPAYLELIRKVFDDGYLKIRTDKDQKALILVGRVEMAEVVIQHLMEHYPELSIGRYISGDSFIEAITNEVIVTTIISGKAAIDVPNLILTFNTVNVGSKETNLQALGRCRELKHIPHIRPHFVYLYTDDIPSAAYYHQHKIKLFESRVFSHHVSDSGFML